ncbi:MAG TPA: glycosyltransferase [Planctomycetota bacterium]
MKILIVDGPGSHPETYARVLCRALHDLGHVIVVHPQRDAGSSWPARHRLRKHAAEAIQIHQPDVVHVLARDAGFVDTYLKHGVPVIHTGEGRLSRADWGIVATRGALNEVAGGGEGLDIHVGRLPFASEISPAPELYGQYALALAPAGDAKAEAWIEKAAWEVPYIPMRREGDPREARFVVAMASTPSAWPSGISDAMAAGRPVIAFWGGAAQEFVLEGVTGFLSAPGDTKSLASHMAFLWDHPEDALRMGGESIRHAREHFAPEVHARTLVRWYLRAGVSRLAV